MQEVVLVPMQNERGIPLAETISIDAFIDAPQWKAICLLDRDDVASITELMTAGLYDDLS